MQIPNSTTLRSIVSPIVAVTFTAVGATGILMLAHVRSFALHAVHEWAGVAMAVASVLHLIINWKAFLSLFRHKRAVIACGLAIISAVGLAAAASGHKGVGPRGGPPVRPCTTAK